MGLSFSSVLYYLLPKKQKRIIIFGLDGAGKTTILYKLKLNEVVNTIPTIGFNVETLDVKNIRFTIWDFRGGESIRRKFRHYLQGTDAVIFVVDSTNEDRIEEAEETLTDMFLSDELKNAPILLLANKQDVPNALSPEKVAERMKMNDKKHKWHVQGTSAYTGNGLYEGLDYLRSVI